MKQRKPSSTSDSHSTSLSMPEITRRNFLSFAAAGAGILAGLPKEVLAQKHRHRKYGRLQRGKKMESRTYVFNLSHMETRAHDLILVAGKQRVPLERLNVRDRLRLRRRHAILRAVPDEHLRHMVTLEMPSQAIQLCYVQRSGRRNAQRRHLDPS